MLDNHHHYAIELLGRDNTPVGQSAIEVDWEPAREWTRFLGIRKGKLPVTDSGRTASIQPIWHETYKKPYVSGFRVAISGNGSGSVAREFRSSYFHEVARRASAEFVERGKLTEGEALRYRTLAIPFAEDRSREPAARFAAQEVAPALPLKESSLADLLSSAPLTGTVEADDIPVLIAERVLDQARELALAAKDKETGGVLIGHLHLDRSRPDILVEVTAQIPAPARGSAAKLEFTPETWTAVRTALDLRKKGELQLGYWHSHPVRSWCRAKGCTPERMQNCSLARGFFSADDQAVLRAAFPRAYSLGLLATDPPFGEVDFSLYGWREGVIERRGYHITGGRK